MDYSLGRELRTFESTGKRLARFAIIVAIVFGVAFFLFGLWLYNETFAEIQGIMFMILGVIMPVAGIIDASLSKSKKIIAYENGIAGKVKQYFYGTAREIRVMYSDIADIHSEDKKVVIQLKTGSIINCPRMENPEEMVKFIKSKIS